MLAPLVFLSLAVAPAPPALSDAQLAALLAPLASTDAQTRRVAAQRITDLGPLAHDALVRRLRQPLRTPPSVFRQLFLEMWAQVPNWVSGTPMWIRRPESPSPKGAPRPARHDPESLDWLVALNEVDLEAAARLDPGALVPAATPTPPPLPPPTTAPAPLTSIAVLQIAREEAIRTVALLRGLAHGRQLEGVAPIFDLAFTYEGVFRDECGRQIRAMGSQAVPELIRLQHTPSTRARPFHKQRRYASYQLDRMDRQRPAKAIATAPDDRVRAAILRAYGEVRAADAVEAVLEEVDAASHRVRQAARWTWLRYVDGPAPPPAPVRKRKLPGGRAEPQEKPDYLTYREIASLALQRLVQKTTGIAPAAGASAKQMTDVLFAYYDRQRAAVWDEEFARAQAAANSGDFQGAVARFGWILAHDPSYARRAEMAPAFVRYADQLRENGELSRALGRWRQAIALAPQGPEARHAAARVALFDALQGPDRADPTPFAHALELDPSLSEARQALTRAHELRRRRRIQQAGAWALASLGLGALLWLFWRRGAGRSA